MAPRRTFAPLLAVLSLGCAARGSSPPAPASPVEAAATGGAGATPAAAAPDRLAAASTTGALDLVCSSATGKLELRGVALRASADGTKRQELRWNELDGSFRLVAGSIVHEGRIAGYRNADYAFIQAESTGAGPNVPASVQLFVGRPAGTSATVSWTVGKDADGDTFQDTDGSEVTCRGSLLTAAPDAAR